MASTILGERSRQCCVQRFDVENNIRNPQSKQMTAEFEPACFSRSEVQQWGLYHPITLLEQRSVNYVLLCYLPDLTNSMTFEKILATLCRHLRHMFVTDVVDIYDGEGRGRPTVWRRGDSCSSKMRSSSVKIDLL